MAGGVGGTRVHGGVAVGALTSRNGIARFSKCFNWVMKGFNKKVVDEIVGHNFGVESILKLFII